MTSTLELAVVWVSSAVPQEGLSLGLLDLLRQREQPQGQDTASQAPGDKLAQGHFCHELLATAVTEAPLIQGEVHRPS